MFKLNLEKIEAAGLEKFKAEKNPAVVDDYGEQLKDLFLIRNPRFRFMPDYQTELQQFTDQFLAGQLAEQSGSWFYFEWSNTLVHYLPEMDYLEARTARNKNLITAEEQQKFYQATIAVAGLSVGSHAALTIAMMGGAKNIKIADSDAVSVTNLNRLRYGAAVMGQKKAHLVAHIIAEMNPYANIYVYDDGVTEQNIADFLGGSEASPKLDILVEEIDNLAMKIVLRLEARKLKIPVIMATDNGDGVIADVERFDLNPEAQIFNGALGDITIEQFKNFNPAELPKLAAKVAGPELIVPRMLASLGEVGKTLYSWPQLGSAATFSGVAAAYLARRIATGADIKSGKYDLNLDKIFGISE